MKLNVENLSYSIGSKLIVDGVNLGVEEGSFVGLVGPNGCGKSTLLKNIYKVYKPDSGAVYVDGKNLAVMSSRETAKGMSVRLSAATSASYSLGTVTHLPPRSSGRAAASAPRRPSR